MRALPALRAAATEPACHQVVEADDLGLDESPLEVGVDDTGGLGRRVADMDGPCARLLGPGGEEGLQPQGGEAHVHQLLQPRLLLPVAAEELPGVGRVEPRHLCLDLGAQHDRLRRTHTFGQVRGQAGVAQCAFVDVEHVNEGLGRQQVQVAQEDRVDFAGRCRARNGAPLAEYALRRGDGVEGGLERRRAPGLLGQAGADGAQPSGGRPGSARCSPSRCRLPGRPGRRRERHRRRGRRARPGRWRRSRGWRPGTGCRAPLPATRRGRGRRCPRRSPSPAPPVRRRRARPAAASRASGTATTPTLGSMVAKG